MTDISKLHNMVLRENGLSILIKVVVFTNGDGPTNQLGDVGPIRPPHAVQASYSDGNWMHG